MFTWNWIPSPFYSPTNERTGQNMLPTCMTCTNVLCTGTRTFIMFNHTKSRKEIEMKYNFKIMPNTGHEMCGIKGEFKITSHMSTKYYKNQKIHLTLQLPIFRVLNQTTNTKKEPNLNRKMQPEDRSKEILYLHIHARLCVCAMCIALELVNFNRNAQCKYEIATLLLH